MPSDPLVEGGHDHHWIHLCSYMPSQVGRRWGVIGEGNYLIPYYRGSLLSNQYYTYVRMYSKNPPYKANAPPKGHAAGVKHPSKSLPTTNLGGWGITVIGALKL